MQLRYHPEMSGITPYSAPAGLGEALRHVRERSERTIRDVSDELNWSSSKLSRIETGRSGISQKDLTSLLHLYKISDEERGRIIGAAQTLSSFRSGRTQSALPERFIRYVELEKRASELTTYAPIIVPGLVQTPEYAREIIRASATPGAGYEPVRMERRMARQAVLARHPPLRLNIVLDESVIRRVVGNKDVMRRQMLRLIEVSDLPNTSIRVLPFSTGAHPAVSGHFAILDFPDGTDAQVFCDGMTGGVLRDRPEDVQLYRYTFDVLTKLALSREESVGLFGVAADGDLGGRRPAASA